MVSKAKIQPWLDSIATSPAMQQLVNAIRRPSPQNIIQVRGLIGSSATLAGVALHRETDQSVVLVFAHLDDVDEAVDEMQSHGVEAARFPAMELLPGESNVNVDLVGERLGLIRRLSLKDSPPVIGTSIQALMQTVPSADQLESLIRVLRVGDEVEMSELIEWLTDAGLNRVATIESPGEFAVRGGIIDVFPPGSQPVRIDFFGNEVESLHEIALNTLASDRRLEQIEITSSKESGSSQGGVNVPFATYLPANTVAILAELIEITEQGRSYMDRVADPRGMLDVASAIKSLRSRASALIEMGQIHARSDESQIDLPVQMLPTFSEGAGEATAELAELARECRTFVLCQNEGEHQRMTELLQEFAPDARVEVHTHYLHRGLIWEGESSFALVPYHELLHRYQTRRRVQRVQGGKERAIDGFIDLQPGDLVVHRDHGVAKFVGMKMMSPGKGDATEEFLTLEFAKRAKLHVPTSMINCVQKYIGAFHGRPELATIGGRKWKRQKEEVASAVRDLAADMLRLQAAREALPGLRYPADTTWQKEFEAEFPYEETEDQIAAIQSVKRDMCDDRPMDRLICGDVGFGKTEVAIRAAFKAVEFGKQVAVLVPTTVLAEQHERTFHDRLADYPFRIESLSRFKTDKEQKKILEGLRKGQVDIIIGTHRLLSKDVRFADLGLVVIDEEQRFGVEHKQKLLELRTSADILTLSATPIPRTLHMAMLGLRDISSLSTAPLDRRAIVTEIISRDRTRLKRAINRELAREGQVFVVHNRVHNIQSVADEIQSLVPEARVIVGHGQMPARQLEEVMLKFTRREADILVCTTIIESGIDIPTANTMLIHDADRFGLSELHQLRGRVGRYKHRAYCYLILPESRVITDVALKRLRALESFSMLGAGFKIALRDLEIRGAGNLLGAEQSGHIAAVGYEMYCELLEHAVDELKSGRLKPRIECTIDLGIAGYIPKAYIPSDGRRMDAYRRINRADSFDSLKEVEQALISAYGELPQATQLIFDIAEIRIAAIVLGVHSITRHDPDIIFKTERPGDLEHHMSAAKGLLRIVGQPDEHGLADVYYRPPKNYFDGNSLINVLRARLCHFTKTNEPQYRRAIG